MRDKKIAIVGGGRLGKSLAFQLKVHGYNVVGLTCGSDATGRQAAEITGIPYGSTTELVARAEVVFITIPDNKLEEVCRQLASDGTISANMTVVHCSGAKPSSILNSAKGMGAQIASMHPLQSFSGFNKNINPFLNVNFTLEGDPEAVEIAGNVAMGLGAAHCYTIDTQGKLLYHAAAVMASNYLVTLFNNAADILEQTGINKDEAFTLLAPLLNGTLKNLANNAPYYEMALTGPITRGDDSVIKAHIQALTEHAPATLDLYKCMGRATVQVAAKQGSLTEKGCELLLETLK